MGAACAPSAARDDAAAPSALIVNCLRSITLLQVQCARIARSSPQYGPVQGFARGFITSSQVGYQALGPHLKMLDCCRLSKISIGRSVRFPCTEGSARFPPPHTGGTRFIDGPCGSDRGGRGRPRIRPCRRPVRRRWCCDTGGALHLVVLRWLAIEERRGAAKHRPARCLTETLGELRSPGHQRDRGLRSGALGGQDSGR
jgi:hypothetical protein